MSDIGSAILRNLAKVGGKASAQSAARARRTRSAAAKAPRTYPLGNFTKCMAPSKASPHGWPPHFVPRFTLGHHSSTAEASMQLAQRRETEAATGVGWGSGTLVMPNTPKHVRPGWVK